LNASHIEPTDALDGSIFPDKVTIIGWYLPPYVRKVRACLAKISRVQEPPEPHLRSENYP